MHEQPVGEVRGMIDFDDEQRPHFGMSRASGNQEHVLGLLGIGHDRIEPDLGPVGNPARERDGGRVREACSIGRSPPRPTPTSHRDAQMRRVPK